MTLAVHSSHQCGRCQATWQVLEIPDGHIDPGRYVCPPCMEQRRAEKVADRLARPASVPYNEIPY